MNNSQYENGIRVKSVADYVEFVSEICDKDDANADVFFRGQKNSVWTIEPSISREELLDIEHILMQDPLLISPSEFPNGFDSIVDTMAKLQHYGMCTRLLDVTTNPFVALYFACGKNDPALGMNREGLSGAVYYKYDYPTNAHDLTVKIISSLTTFNLSQENTLTNVLSNLMSLNIISRELMEKWGSSSGFVDFIKIIQSTKTVVTTYSNTRLIAQSGAFLLSGMFNFALNNESLGQSIITKARQNLRDEFSKQFFYICESDKEKILNELNLYKINESTLFPELEHQLNYLKLSKKRFAKSVESFVCYKGSDKLGDDSRSNYINNVDKAKYLDKIKAGITRDFPFFTIDVIDSILSILDNCLVVDWYKRPMMLSGLRFNLKQLLTKYMCGRDKTQVDIDIKTLVRLFVAEWVAMELD